MAYLPKNKYKKLYTKGNEFRLATTGQPYTGEYIKLTNGQRFAGSDPSNLKGKLIEIAPTRGININQNERNNQIYSILQKSLSQKQNKYIPILGAKPSPTILDYSNGYFLRFIAVRLNTQQYKEISGDVYDNFDNRDYNKVLNKVFFIKWYLGNDNETKNSNNLRTLENDLPGIFNFFSNKSEYGMKNGVISLNGNRIYIDGKLISKNLPVSYQLGNKNVNEIKNPNVPSNQNCSKCFFFKEGFCKKWEADVKNEYYCRAYRKKGIKPPDPSGY